MRTHASHKTSNAILAASAIYALSSAAFGKTFADFLFTFFMPRLYSAMGLLVFDHFSDALTVNKKQFSFIVLGSLLLLLAGCLIKRGPIKNAADSLGKFYKIYFTALLILITAAFFIASTRVAPAFTICSLIIIALHLRASSVLIDLEDEPQEAARLIKSTLVKSIAVAAAFSLVKGFWLGMAIFLVFLAAFFLITLGKLKRKTARTPAASPARISILIFVSSFSAVGHFWLSSATCDSREMLRAGAKLIASASYRPYDMLTASGKVFIAYKEGAVAGHNIASGARTDYDKVAFKGSTQRMIHNPETDELYSTLWRAEGAAAVYVMKLYPRLHFDRVLTIDNCPAIGLELDHESRQLLVLCEAGDKVVWFDYLSWKQTGLLQFPRFTWPHSIKLDPARRLVYVCSGSMSKYLYEIDARTKRIKRKTDIGYVSLGMAYDPDAKRAYIAKPFSGGALVVDTKNMRRAGWLNARGGVRDLDIDPARGLLYAGNYIDGTFQTIRIADGKSVSEVFAGKQVRGVYHDCNTGENYAASACGVFRILK